MLHQDQLQQQSRKKPNKRSRRRLPNGYGSVHEIKDGKYRRKPWRARVSSHLVFDKETGTCTQKYINLGCFATEKEAIDALAAYRQDPYNYEAANITFEDVYHLWNKQAFPKLSKSAQYSYQAAYKHSEPLHKLKMREIRALQLERVMVSTTTGAATQANIKNLWLQLFKYALKHDLVQRNYAEMISTKDKPEGTKRTAIPPEDRAKLWALADAGDHIAKIALIYIYTGMRASELLNMEKANVHMESRMMIGGEKTAAGKNRHIPIHRCILPFIQETMGTPGKYLIVLDGKGLDKPVSHKYFYPSVWKPWAEKMNMPYTPHFCRHTFATISREANIAEDLRKLIMGHANGDITDRYTHHPDYMLLEAMDAIPDRA